MTQAVTPDEDAGRTLIARVQHFLNMVEKEDRLLGPWETDQLGRILGCLEIGYYRVGLDLIGQVENPDLYRSPEELAAVAKGPVLTVAEVRSNLANVIAKISE